MNKRKTSTFEQHVFKFLNALRNSCRVNMSTEAPVIVSEEFNVELPKAVNLWKTWKGNFNEEGNYDEVNDNK